MRDLKAGKIETLVLLGGNPVYNAPVDFQFADQLGRVPLRIRLGLYEDETSALCQWHIPETHPLETWSDARAFDGMATITQPLIEPLYGGKSAHELVAALAGSAVMNGYEIVRQYWITQHAGNEFEKFWRKSLHDGLVQGSAGSKPSLLAPQVRAVPSASGLELAFSPGPTIRDGRFANNAWLQELPQPFTKITWDNAALVSPATAKRLQLAHEDVVDLRYRGRSIRAPMWILPGQADDCVTVHLGYGRTRAGHVGNGVGFDAYALRTSDAPWGGPGLEMVKTGRAACPLRPRNTIRAWKGATRFESARFPNFRSIPPPSRRRSEPPPGRTKHSTHRSRTKATRGAWRLTSALASVATSAPLPARRRTTSRSSAKKQVARGREMHWIRVDSYFEGAPADPRLHFQPVPCMHCENAPCELVCPVAATVHSCEGLNQMVYNRCIGTRYCSNNCPYKVRRFNFLEYDRNRFESAPVAQTHAQSRRDSAHARRDGKMHVLRSAHQRACGSSREKANRADSRR